MESDRIKTVAILGSLMALVEVIRGDRTSAETVAAGVDFARALGKTPVVCRDTPAFIVNRVARPFYGEGLRLLGESAADPATIDALMKSLGFKMGRGFYDYSPK